MKRERKSKKTLTRLAQKRHARSLRSRAKQAHRRGTGHKDLEESQS